MGYFVGMDVGKDRTALCVTDAQGKTVLEVEVATDPDLIRDAVAPLRSRVEAAGLEAGGMSSWLARRLAAEGLAVVQVDAGRLSQYARASPSKTDRSDARTIADALRSGMYREVVQKSPRARRIGTLLGQRQTLLREGRRLELSIRGTLRSSGLRMDGSGGARFRDRVHALVEDEPELRAILLPALDAREAILAQFQRLDRQALEEAMHSPIVQRFVAIPGVGALTALSFVATIDDPRQFPSSRHLTSYLGLSPRILQSGATTRLGGITKRGDQRTRSHLYQAAQVHLTRSSAETAINRWGRQVAQRRGTKRAITACARKLAITMHCMWVRGEDYRPL